MSSHLLQSRHRCWIVLLSLTALLLTGCAEAREERDQYAAPASRYTERELQASQRYGGSHAGGQATGDTDRGAAFARWVLEQDPRREYLTAAVVRNEQVLGIKVQPGLSRNQVSELLTALGRGMAREFPGRSVVVTAFDQSGDRLAEGVVNPRTSRVDVQFG